MANIKANYVVLFDNDANVFQGAITLSESAANFEKLTICFKSNDNVYCSMDVARPNGKVVALTTSFYNGTNYFYVKNRCYKIDGKIITPDISGGTVLPGITRKSCIQVLKDWGYEVEERKISVDELIDAAESGRLEEAWGCGTAAVVSPIGLLSYKDKDHIIADNKIGPVTQRLYDELTGIQWGKVPDTRGWIVKVC